MLQRSDASSANDSDMAIVRPSYIILGLELAQAIALLTVTFCLYATGIIAMGLMRYMSLARKPGSGGSGPSRNYWTR